MLITVSSNFVMVSSVILLIGFSSAEVRRQLLGLLRKRFPSFHINSSRYAFDFLYFHWSLRENTLGSAQDAQFSWVRCKWLCGRPLRRKN